MQTCLSKGGGYHFPPCHILNVCGFRILLDCPLDLSALTIFSPISSTSKVSSLDEEDPKCSNRSDPLDLEEPLARKRKKVERPLDANDLIYAEPWYKTVKNLHLWNTSFIDVVLISSPMGMLGLPFLTRIKGFSAKVWCNVIKHSVILFLWCLSELVLNFKFSFFQGFGSDWLSFGVS